MMTFDFHSRRSFGGCIISFMLKNPRCAVTRQWLNYNRINMFKNPMPHHYITRAAGGTDGCWNLERLCPAMHAEAHKRGIKDFAIKYGLEKPRKILIDKEKWMPVDEELWQVNRAIRELQK